MKVESDTQRQKVRCINRQNVKHHYPSVIVQKLFKLAHLLFLQYFFFVSVSVHINILQIRLFISAESNKYVKMSLYILIKTDKLNI